MFTGLVQRIGTIEARDGIGGDVRLRINCDGDWLDGVALGDSIAVSGVCLTVIDFGAAWFAADVSNETLACTSLGDLEAGGHVNLEKSLRPTDAIGGHLVSGHVDAVTTVLAREPDARSERLVFAIPPGLAHLIAPKGNICVDGTSLTVNEVAADRFGVNIVPHTLEHTVVGGYRAGTRVNLEIDLIARYVARVLSAGHNGDNSNGES